MIEKYMRVEDFFKDSKPCTIAEDVRKEMELYHLLQTYSQDYVEKTFHYSKKEIAAHLKDHDPVGDRRRELEHIASIAELMPKIVGAEGHR
jgi:hypothetical protein